MEILPQINFNPNPTIISYGDAKGDSRSRIKMIFILSGFRSFVHKRNMTNDQGTYLTTDLWDRSPKNNRLFQA